LDSKALASALRRAGAYLSRPFLLNGVIAPLMHRIGEAWADGSLRIIHEHGASNVVKGFLWDLIGNAAAYTDAPAMVVATPAGQICEIGAMIATLTAADCGWNAFYFGPNLPAEEIAAAALHERAAAVALSIACAMRPESIERELLSLKQSLGSAVDLFIGGRAARAHQAAVVSAGGRYFESLYEFAEFILQIN
jgi:methylmalonyl-CoA mutase cobalamin-binding subunit